MHRTHKTIAIFAVAMAAVFLIVVVIYPMIFNPNEMNKPASEPEPVVNLHHK